MNDERPRYWPGRITLEPLNESSETTHRAQIDEDVEGHLVGAGALVKSLRNLATMPPDARPGDALG